MGGFTEYSLNRPQPHGEPIPIGGELCLGSGSLPGRTKWAQKDTAPIEVRVTNSQHPCILLTSSQNVCSIFYATMKEIPVELKIGILASKGLQTH